MSSDVILAREAFRAGDYEGALLEAQSLLRQSNQVIGLTNVECSFAEPVEIWLLLAAVWQAKGFSFESELAYRQAAKLLPSRADIQLNLAHTLRRNEQMAEAEQIYRDAASRSPDNIPVCLALMAFLSECGRHDEAVSAGEAMLSNGAEHPDLRHAIGNAHFAASHFDEALAVYQSALIFSPAHIPLLYAAALAAIHAGKSEQAEQFLLKVIKAQPSHLYALLKLADLKKAAGDLESVVEYARRAVEVSPKILEPHERLTDALIELRRHSAAIVALDEAIEAGCASQSIFLTHAALLLKAGERERAGRVISLGTQRFPESMSLLSLALRLKRDVCEWETLVEQTGTLLVKTLTDEPEGFSAADPTVLIGAPLEINAGQLLNISIRYARQYAMSDDPPVEWTPPSHVLIADGKAKSSRPLRLAYLVSDLQLDGRADYLQGLLGRHDPEGFKVTVYILGGDSSLLPVKDVPYQVVSLFGQSISQSVTKIKQGHVDILINLAGEISEHLPVLLQKPAKLQIAWPGFAASMGCRAVDYILSDKTCLPENEIVHFIEAPIWMPHSLSYFEAGVEAAQIVPIRPVCKLPTQGVVFANFSEARAIDAESFRAWMRVLRHVPGSVMWLGVSDPLARQNLTAVAAAVGVQSERLIFAEAVPLADQLARLRHADLYFVPHNDTAGNSAMTALWAGVPVLACDGHGGLVSRLAQSELLAADLAECLLPDLSSLEMRAVDLAKDRHALHALRFRLSERKQYAPLFDSAGFVNNLENALQTIWVNHEQGGKPCPVNVEPLSDWRLRRRP